MSATVMDGKTLSAKVKEEVKIKVEKFTAEYGRPVCLAVVLVGSDSASEVYVRNKIKGCEYTGIKSLSFNLPDNATESDVAEVVNSLATDEGVDGILVQLPLPKGLDENKILSLIPPDKDVDGFLAENVGNLLLGKNSTVACTPFGVMKMLVEYGVDLSGKNTVVIGRSNIVGKPMALLLLQSNATVTVCHSKTKNIKEICKNADVIVAALGKAGFVTADMVKDGAVVIDVGINRVDGKLKGDVDFDGVKEKASLITPVPGGVGPMTIAMLLENTYLCAVRRESAKV